MCATGHFIPDIRAPLPQRPTGRRDPWAAMNVSCKENGTAIEQY